MVSSLAFLCEICGSRESAAIERDEEHETERISCSETGPLAHPCPRLPSRLSEHSRRLRDLANWRKRLWSEAADGISPHARLQGTGFSDSRALDPAGACRSKIGTCTQSPQFFREHGQVNAQEMDNDPQSCRYSQPRRDEIRACAQFGLAHSRPAAQTQHALSEGVLLLNPPAAPLRRGSFLKFPIQAGSRAWPRATDAEPTRHPLQRLVSRSLPIA